MKKLFAFLFAALLGLVPQAHARTFDQAELDALLAPVALYPDPLLSQVLMAATYPQDVAEAAVFSRAYPQLKGEEAVRAADPYPWDPSVKFLLAFPDVLARMEESPQWTADLGQAFLAQEPHVMDTVQALRRRAYASGHLRSDPYHSVQHDGPTIAVVPVQPHVVYVPYYNPYVVYGPWWWPHYRPVVWRAWRPAPVVLSVNFFHRHASPHRWRHHHRVPEAQRQPIVRSHSLPPARHVETPRRLNEKREAVRERGIEQRREPREQRHGFRVEERKEQHKERRREARHHRDRRG